MPAPTVTLSVDKTAIYTDESVTFTWSSTNATSVSIAGFTGTTAVFLANVSASGSLTDCPNGPHDSRVSYNNYTGNDESVVYTITATGTGGSATDSKTVNIFAVPTISLNAGLANIYAGDTDTLAWHGSDSVAIDHGIGSVGPDSPFGGLSLGVLTSSQMYTATCTRVTAAGTRATTSSATITVFPVPTVTLTATPSTFSPGDTITLAWTSANSDSVSINQGIGTVTPTAGGSTTVTGTVTRTYQATATVTTAAGTRSAFAFATITRMLAQAAALALDCISRPAAALARTGGLSFETTQDAGHTYAGHIADTATGTADHSLIYDRRTGQPRLIYTTASTIKTRLASANGENSDWGTDSALTGISGNYPIACEHPSLNGCVYLAYLDAGSLKLAASYSGGDPASWSAVSTIATGLDFSASGRAALVPVSGVVLLAVYASGSSLLAKASSDGGATWGSAITIASSGPYSRIAGAGHLGQAAIMAMTGTSTLHLWVSGELGATWTAGTAPALPTDPAGLLWEPQTGIIRYGETLQSVDRGGAWIAT